MQMRLPILAFLLSLAPLSAHAQGLPVNYDADAAYAPQGDMASLTQADHPPSTTETSPARAHVVRHGERTVRLIDNAAASGSTTMVVASAAPVGS